MGLINAGLPWRGSLAGTKTCAAAPAEGVTLHLILGWCTVLQRCRARPY